MCQGRDRDTTNQMVAFRVRRRRRQRIGCEMSPLIPTLTTERGAETGGVRSAAASKPFLVRCIVAVAGVSAIAVAIQVGECSTVAKSLAGLSYIVAPGIAGLECLRRGWRCPEEPAWRWLGGSCLVWAAGGTVLAFYGVTRHHHPFPSIADLGFVGYALPAVVGLLSLRSPARGCPEFRRTSVVAP